MAFSFPWGVVGLFFSCAAPGFFTWAFSCAGVGGLFAGYRASCLPRSHPLPRADWVWALSASTCLSRLAAFSGRLSSFRGVRPCRAPVCAMVVSLFPSSALCGGGYRVRLLLLVPRGSCLTRDPPPLSWSFGPLPLLPACATRVWSPLAQFLASPSVPGLPRLPPAPFSHSSVLYRCCRPCGSLHWCGEVCVVPSLSIHCRGLPGSFLVGRDPYWPW